MSLFALALLLQGLAHAPSEDPRIAWDRIEDSPRSVDSYLARAQLLARAGDPAGALESAQRGLELDSSSLSLLYQAAYAALWLEYVTAATGYCVRLTAAVSQGHLSEAESRAWTQAAEDLRSRSLILSLHVRSREKALSAARWIAIGGVASVFAAIALLATREVKSPTAS